MRISIIPLMLACSFGYLAAECPCGVDCPPGCDCGCGVEEFEVEECCEVICIENPIYESLNPCGLSGVWLPEAPHLFRPFIANPKQETSSVNLRFNDQVVEKHVAAVSYSDMIPVYRWFDVFTKGGQLELDIDGNIWAIFQPFLYSAPLVDADYYIGFSLNYAWEQWSFRLRGFHISTHIGDEFLLNHPNFHRVNPSAEYIDFAASYQMTDDIRIYAMAGCIPFKDSSYSYKPFYFEFGSELYMPWFRFISYCQMIEGRPFFAMDFRLSEDNRYGFDSTFALGYEFAKLCGLERRLRAYVEYHDGYSVDGQFSRCSTNYLSVGVSYGY